VRRAERTGRGIALEDLKGIRGRIRATRSQRGALHSWAFAQLKQPVLHKAQLAGVPVEPDVDPRNTSRQCPRVLLTPSAARSTIRARNACCRDTDGVRNTLRSTPAAGLDVAELDERANAPGVPAWASDHSEGSSGACGS